MARRARPVAPQRVVGIGASAGGLDALRQLLSHVPVDTGLAIVVLQHLPPSQRGQLARLLASAATLPVVDVASGRRLQPDTIAVVPPHTAAHLSRGALVLRTAKVGSRPRNPIDTLFQSLAAVLGDRAAGVVLSGTASDGTEGLRAIRDAGGMTFAQDPATAEFDAMPRNAIAAGVVAVSLDPARIGELLASPAPTGARAVVPGRRASEAPAIDRVLDQLREASGIDFTSYKRTTIERRLARRLAKLELASLDEYGDYLAAHPDEARSVYDDLLVHVTEFFRDRRALDRLVTELVPELVRTKPHDAPLRVWVPGCSTGEEVYSLAILLLERIGASGRPVQLFGSDLSEHSIDTARRGFYPAAIAGQVGSELLARYFHREDSGYRIASEVRERCVFVRHDLVTDPPFSRLDVVSCRNVLIYLGAPLQRRVLPLFHYALNQPGYLVLGRAESIAGFDALFDAVDTEAHIYARRPGTRALLTFPIASQLGRQPWRRPAEAARSQLDVQRDADHVLLARYAPACVVVDEQLEVVQFRGRTGAYLEPPPGQPQYNLLRMARDGLASELPLAIQRARRTNATVRRENLKIRERGRDLRFHLEVVPIGGGLVAKPHFLVIFEPTIGAVTAAAAGRSATGPRGRTELGRLRQELDATKEYLHTVTSQHLATSEELGIANEELQSTNEELQSTNEELQTAKEELQSANEELETVNEELQRGNAQLHDANDDLVNVIGSVEIAIIMVDLDRRVRRFTPTARAVMRLIPSDVGRPIADLQPSVVIPGLDAAITDVIESLAIHESEVRHPDGTTYRMQIRPYRTTEQEIRGAVISFVEITSLRAASDYTAAIVESVPTPLAVIDHRLRVQSANRAFHSGFATAAAEVDGHSILDIGEWRSDELRAALDTAAATGVGFTSLEVEHVGRPGERLLQVNATPIPPIDGRRLMLLAAVDVTEQRRFDLAREAASRERDAFLDAVSHELRTPLSAILLWAEALRDLAPDDPRRLQAIDTIAQSARVEAQLIDDLIELALSRTSDLAVTPEVIDAAEVVRTAVDAARPDATGKRVGLDATLAPGSGISADPRRLRQIAANLIGNAIKFTPAGGRVTVELAVVDREMTLRVRDTGPGIAPDLIGRLFEPFAQGDRSSTRAHRGLGIGLALVRYFVERQQGTIAVASGDNGHGTTFTVRIPGADRLP